MPTLSTPSALRAAKRRLVSETIWHAALERFGAQGYPGTTIEQIAEAAGVSRRTFFRYFSSKEAIVVFAMDAYGALIEQAIDDAAGAGRPVDIVRAAVLRVAEFVVAQPDARQAMQITDDHPAVKAAQLSRLHRIESKVAAGFGRALGLRSPSHPHAAALAATTLMLVDLTLRAWYRRESSTLAGIVDALIGGLQLLGEERSPSVPRQQRSHSRRVAAPSR